MVDSYQLTFTEAQLNTLLKVLDGREECADITGLCEEALRSTLRWLEVEVEKETRSLLVNATFKVSSHGDIRFIQGGRNFDGEDGEEVDEDLTEDGVFQYFDEDEIWAKVECVKPGFRL